MSNPQAREWRFEALDSLFFRESRPFELIGGVQLESVFPPPARTVAGAVRTLIGEGQEVDWQRFQKGAEYQALREQIGNADGLGRLRLVGPYLTRREDETQPAERLYPMPLHLLAKVHPENEGKREYVFLRPGQPVKCDLDQSLPVRLPELARPLDGAKPRTGDWLDGTNLARILEGKDPDKSYPAGDLFSQESRLGIARNNAQATVEEGLLYQTRHVRPRPEVAVAVAVQGIDSGLHPKSGLLRFGGEGRAAAVTVTEPGQRLSPPRPKAGQKNLLLMLLTPADFGGGWLPPGFEEAERDGVRVWQGSIEGIPLTLECAVLGKAVREGGWDLANNCPRPMTSLVPAGSVYFCTVPGDMQAALDTLHGCHLGNDTELGRGELAVGLWNE